MGRLSIQLGIANSAALVETAPLLDDGPRRSNISLLIESVLAVVVGVVAIKVFGASSALGPAWLITPAILVIAALLPTAIRRRKFPPLGLNIKNMKDSPAVLGWTCLAVFPVTFCGLWLLGSFGFGLPVRPILPQEQHWSYWLFYQFMYIALAEEVFFRGYMQSNILALTAPVMGKWPRRQEWMSIGISAACFALAHVLIQGRIASVLTFLPGLVLGWLFIRTKSLFAPILFHGLANTYYLVISAVLG